jgi:leucyl aminopeptidase
MKMNFNVNTSIDHNIDIILPQRKDQLSKDQIENLTGIRNPDFKGEFKESLLIYTKNGKRLYLLGLGNSDDVSKAYEAFRKLTNDTQKSWSESIQLDARQLSDAEVGQAVFGMESATYKIGFYKKEQPEETAKEISVSVIAEVSKQSIIVENQFAGETINRIKKLVDEPANFKTPEHLAKWVSESAKKYEYRCKIYSTEDLEKENFGAILAVGKGSIHPPYLIVSHYLPNKKGKIDLGLVGKGITFDTGGISIKAANNMHYMKSDMGGAAVVLGTVELAARLKLNVNIVGVVAAAENAVDAKSFRPGDVIHSYSGKTIEVIDTDAEGRLVLADGLNYIIKKYQPERVIDLATLTGSIVRTLGYSAAGLFTKNKEMIDDLTKIGEDINERVWPLPLYSDFDEELHSDIADIKNLGNKPLAGAIVAAKFLEAFTEDHKSWAHIDIAGVSFGTTDHAKMKSATGYGVRLLIQYLKTIIEKKDEESV